MVVGCELRVLAAMSAQGAFADRRLQNVGKPEPSGTGRRPGLDARRPNGVPCFLGLSGAVGPIPRAIESADSENDGEPARWRHLSRRWIRRMIRLERSVPGLGDRDGHGAGAPDAAVAASADVAVAPSGVPPRAADCGDGTPAYNDEAAGRGRSSGRRVGRGHYAFTTGNGSATTSRPWSRARPNRLRALHGALLRSTALSSPSPWKQRTPRPRRACSSTPALGDVLRRAQSGHASDTGFDCRRRHGAVDLADERAIQPTCRTAPSVPGHRFDRSPALRRPGDGSRLRGLEAERRRFSRPAASIWAQQLNATGTGSPRVVTGRCSTTTPCPIRGRSTRGPVHGGRGGGFSWPSRPACTRAPVLGGHRDLHSITCHSFCLLSQFLQFHH